MSKLEELIQQYCPDGVEWKPLGEVCDIHKGVQFNKTDMKEVGTYPVINGGINPSGYAEVFNEEKDTITISQGGASAGYVNFLRNKFWLGAHCYAVIPYDTILNKYLYHFIKMNEVTLQQCQYGAGIPALAKSTISSLEIPVPPLPVQEEIARILDIFTELQAELQAELQKRKLQYNYYLDNLLNFNRGGYQAEVRWMKIDDICDVFTGGEVPMGSIKGSTPFGGFIYPIWGNGKEIYGYATTYQIDKDAVCVSSIGANSGTVFFHKAYFTPIIRLKVLIPRNASISVRYLFYILSFIGFDVKKSSVPNMNSNEVKQKVIPVPSLDEQQRIVSILDRFDRLTNDLTSGLPAEIEKRRQQYEYYRDKLLTFKRKAA